MCGIIAIIGNEVIDDDKLQAHLAFLERRGPDYSSRFSKYHTKCGLSLQLKASILHMRGDNIQIQPVLDSNNNILLFNGQIYENSNLPLDKDLSDTTFLADKLSACTNSTEISRVISSLCGPFAFIYWRDDLNSLFFGRDVFGRKSLCLLTNEEEGSEKFRYLALSSIAKQVNSSLECKWSEVSCAGLHCLEFSSVGELKSQLLFNWDIEEAFPRTNKCSLFEAKGFINHISMTCPFSPLNKSLRNCNEFSEEEKQLVLNEFELILSEAISKRIRFERKICLDCRKLTNLKSCNHSKFAVAFSGGVDSTLLALLMDKLIDEKETIDLLTVAFKKEAPDRSSVYSAFKELRYLCPKRCWRLVICDVSILELVKERNEIISHLIAPCNKVVDDSLGCACYFIGQGKGRAIDSIIDDDEFDRVFDNFIHYDLHFNHREYGETVINRYVSPAATIFIGSGIDEQLGGYSSHRAAWLKQGTKGVFEEISFQMRRISERNLGRDDRIYSHHSRDAKLPYLDTHIVNYLNQLPIGLKMDLNDSLEVGPKKLLRDLAYKLGLSDTSKRIKRALQFGTRIANLEHSKEKGNDICSRLT